MCSTSARTDAGQSAGELIEGIGIGLYQLNQGLLGGGLWMVDGAELLLISSVARAVSTDWGLLPMQRGVVVSIVFLGVGAGNFLSGPIADTMGRKWPIVCSYAGCALFSVISALSTGFWTLCVARFLVGTAFGFGQPAVNTYLSEISPLNWRFTVSVVGGLLWNVGELYSALLLMIDDPSLENLHWRCLLVAGALPSCVGAILAAVFLKESVVWLAPQRKQQEAMCILDSMRYWNGCPQVDISILSVGEVGTEPQKAHPSIIFGRDLWFSTLVACFTCFTINIVYYGSLYAFPQVLSTGVGTSASPAVALVFGTVWEFVGCLLAIPLGLYVDRRPSLTIAGTLLVISIFAFATGGLHAHDGSVSFFIGFVGIKMTISILTSIAYVYTTEIYPTSARASGASMSFGCGRLGAIVAPLAYEQFMVLTGTWTNFFYGMGALMAVTSLLPAFLPFETRGMILQDSVRKISRSDSMLPWGSEKPHEP